MVKRVDALTGIPECYAEAGHRVSLAVSTDGRLWGWGYGQNEMLGLQLDADQHTPKESPTLQLHGWGSSPVDAEPADALCNLCGSDTHSNPL